MNNPFNYIPNKECEEAFRQLLIRLDALKESTHPRDIILSRELEAGKMLGVMIAEDKTGNRKVLYAFSGQLGKEGFFAPGFVGPVFDYLQPEGYFKTREADISRQNKEIAEFEKNILVKIKAEYEEEKKILDVEIADLKKKNKLSKLERKRRREEGVADESELAEMLRQSQFEKAELHRLKKRVREKLEPFAERLSEAQIRLEAMKEKRHSDSEALQQWLFNNFRLLNAKGETKTLNEIFAETSMKIPPSGAGECCAPKLLQTAYKQNLKPLAIAEYWYGEAKQGEVRRHGDYYPACRGKCLPILSFMMQGLCIEPSINTDSSHSENYIPKIIYENEWFCVVDKPSGMLSVPGKESLLSLQVWLEKRYGSDREVKMAHRLDQDTSGLMIATFGRVAYKVMQWLFATRKMTKTYVAELEGDYTQNDLPEKGVVNLPLSPDWLDRPRQLVNFDGGKDALTDYEFTGVSGNHSRILFHPHTGRTHQLRVHAASEQGLGMAIVGDRLYGKNGGRDSNRLHLHAQRIEFTFPVNGAHYRFESPVPF